MIQWIKLLLDIKYHLALEKKIIKEDRNKTKPQTTNFSEPTETNFFESCLLCDFCNIEITFVSGASNLLQNSSCFHKYIGFLTQGKYIFMWYSGGICLSLCWWLAWTPRVSALLCWTARHCAKIVHTSQCFNGIKKFHILSYNFAIKYFGSKIGVSS